MDALVHNYNTSIHTLGALMGALVQDYDSVKLKAVKAGRDPRAYPGREAQLLLLALLLGCNTTILLNRTSASINAPGV